MKYSFTSICQTPYRKMFCYLRVTVVYVQAVASNRPVRDRSLLLVTSKHRVQTKVTHRHEKFHLKALPYVLFWHLFLRVKLSNGGWHNLTAFFFITYMRDCLRTHSCRFFSIKKTPCAISVRTYRLLRLSYPAMILTRAVSMFSTNSCNLCKVAYNKLKLTLIPPTIKIISKCSASP